MKKNGRTLREDIVLIKRGLKEFHHILPGQMKHIYQRGILASVIPFIPAVFSAFIIDELTSAKNPPRLLILILSAVFALFFATLLKDQEDARIAVGYSHLFSAHEMYLTNKSHRIPYELLEKNSTRELREQVTGSISVSGAGMASLYWDMDVLFTNSFTAILAIVICTDFIRRIVVWDIFVNETIGNSLQMIALLLLLVAICCCISCRMQAKRWDISFEVFQNGAKYNRYGEFYTLNYLCDENAALDVRVYEQEKVIVRESQVRCYKPFAEGKVKEMKAVKRYDGIKLICSCICGSMVYLIIGQKAIQGAIGCGSIVMMYAAVTMLIQSLSEVAQIIADLRNNNEYLIHFFQYMDLPESEEEQGDGIPPAEGFKSIVFQNVSFQYPESETYVLRNVNLKVHAGEKIAIVGENGSGKTTLIKLLCRLYRPTEGEILLDGKDIWSYSYSEYMNCISAVFQDFSLFAFSLAENVACAKDYDSGLVKKALEIAGLKQKLSRLEYGIHQNLFHDFKEDGTDLSGGEAQKVAIARAIYKNGEIMILDEPTAALDPYAEYDIYQNFYNITEDKTVFSISHRLSSCRMCDRIVVMEQGKIIQCGSHAQLLQEQDKKYYEMWIAQAQYYM